MLMREVTQVEGGILEVYLSHMTGHLDNHSSRLQALARLQLERILQYTELTAYVVAVNFV